MSRISVESRLAEVYGPEAIYVQEMELIGEHGNARRANVFGRVSEAQACRSFDPPPFDRLENISGVVVATIGITKEHNKGHFIGRSVYPGHKGILAAASLAATLADPSSDQLPINPRIVSIEGTRFHYPAFPGDNLVISQSEINEALQSRFFEIRKNGTNGTLVSEIIGLRIGTLPGKLKKAALLDDQLIETMAQAAAVTAFDFQEVLDGLPMFARIGRTRFFGYASLGDVIEMRAATSTDDKNRGFKGVVEAFVGNKKIAECFGLEAKILSKNVAKRLFGPSLG